MEKSIENKFFEAFKWGGVVDNCIDWMRYTYNLPPVKPTDIEAYEAKSKDDKWNRVYSDIILPKILKATEAFDDSVIDYMESPLMYEIEANLSECQTEAQRERYLYSLLKPFGESPNGCGIARIYNPTAELNQLKEAIKDCEKDKAFWQTLPEDENLKNVNGKPCGTPKEQIEACNSMCKYYQEQIDWVYYVNRRFCELTMEYGMQEGTVEYCMRYFNGIYSRFANRLDALLLTYGIDLMKLQKESGLYLKDNRIITDVEPYIGSLELAQKYINALPKQPQPEQEAAPQPTAQEPQQSAPESKQERQPEQPLKDILPEELRNDEAVKIFQKGIDARLIEQTPQGLKWKATKQLLAYFSERMSNKFELSDKLDKDGNVTINWSIFETLFEVNDLKGAKQNWMRLNTMFTPTRYKKVDALFE